MGSGTKILKEVSCQHYALIHEVLVDQIRGNASVTGKLFSGDELMILLPQSFTDLFQ